MLTDDAEILRGHVLELVRLVDDGVAAFGDHFAVRALPDRRVGAQQVMVHDDEVRLGGALSHARDEAVGVARALGADAVFRCCGDLSPERQVLGQVCDLGAIAGLRPLRPFVDDGKKNLRRGLAEQLERACFRALAERFEPVQAQVVAAALHVGGGERHIRAPRAGRRGP